jgi:hypothetical protein
MKHHIWQMYLGKSGAKLHAFFVLYLKESK